MERIWGAVAAAARAAAWAGGGLLIAAAFVVTAEVISRKGIGIIFSGSDEIASYLFAVGTSWSMAHVLVTRGHVRIDALWVRLSPPLRAACDLVALLTLGLFVAVLAERGYALTAESIEMGARSNTPLQVRLAIPQVAWFLGICLFFLTLLLALLRTVVALVSGNLAAASAISGAQTQDEEIDAELKGLGLQQQGKP